MLCTRLLRGAPLSCILLLYSAVLFPCVLLLSLRHLHTRCLTRTLLRTLAIAALPGSQVLARIWLLPPAATRRAREWPKIRLCESGLALAARGSPSTLP